MNTMKTKTIAGHEITLETGIAYRASRPMASRKGELFTVTISCLACRAMDDDTDRDARIHGLTYDESNELLNAFNDGLSSFDGRVW